MQTKRGLMRRRLWLLAAVLFGAMAVTGCAKKNAVNTSKLEKSFQSADPKNKEYCDQAVTAAKSNDYTGTLAGLHKLAGRAKLTSEQQLAIKDTIVQVEKAMTDMANKANDDAQKKAANDMKKPGPPK
jgi:hypothetical protein